MAFKKPTPKSFTPDELQSITTASAEQTGKSGMKKSLDDNYPVFAIPKTLETAKVLAYVPNHTVMTPDGISLLRMDKFVAHPITHGRMSYKARCTQGIVVPSLNLDGSCPLCDAMSDVWELVHAEFSATVRAKGGDPDDETQRETWKPDWRNARNSMVMNPAFEQVTFPIVVVECTEEKGRKTTTPKINADGTITGTPMWYTCSYQAYEEKWIKALETVQGDPTSPAGLWVVLNYSYTPEAGQQYKPFDAARKVVIGYKAMPENYNAWAQSFDKMTEEWTPAKAMEVVVDNLIRDMGEQTELTDTIMKGTRDKLAMYQLAGNGGAPQMPVAGVLNSASESLAQFGAMEVAGQLPQQTVPQQIPMGQPTPMAQPTLQVAPQVTPMAQPIPQAVPQQIPTGVPMGQPMATPQQMGQPMAQPNGVSQPAPMAQPNGTVGITT